MARSACDRPEQKARFEQILHDLTGQRIVVEFGLLENEVKATPAKEQAPRVPAPHQRLLQVAQHPLVRRAGELFRASPVRVDDPAEQKPE